VDKLTPKQELFVQGIISGLSQRQAYRQAYPSAKKWRDNVVDNKASELLKNGEVLVRYRELLKQFSNMSLWSREQAFNEYEWLKNNNPNVRRAVTEGLRIWTIRPYFKENPSEAIRRIAALKDDYSEYVRKSVGNSLRDISKKFPELIKIELDSWKLESKEIKQVYKLASKLIV